jgi:hypothetical protein
MSYEIDQATAMALQATSGAAELFQASKLLRKKLEGYTGQAAPTYRWLHTRILNGVVPAVDIRGRWYCREADVPLIAERIGMTRARSAA